MNKNAIKISLCLLVLIIALISLISVSQEHPYFQKFLGELFIFPFRASVWGSSSDILMVVVTGVTARYLYLTLKSQKEVQGLNTINTIIANDQYRNSVKPLIFFTPSITHEGNDDEDFYNGIFRGHTKIGNAGGFAKNIRLSIKQGTKGEETSKSLHFETVKSLYKHTYHSVFYGFNQEVDNEEHRKFLLEVSFEDIIGNEYMSEQYLYYSFMPYKTQSYIDTVKDPRLVRSATEQKIKLI